MYRAVLWSTFAALSAAAPVTVSGSVAYIDVTAATLWTNPHKPQEVDHPALINPVHLQEWLNGMTLHQYLALTNGDRTQTQGLYGTRVNILNVSASGDWYEIAVNGQPTPKNPLGYPGWVPAVQLSFDEGYGALQDSRPFAQVVQPNLVASLYSDPQLQHEIIPLSIDTRLPVLSSQPVGQAIPVRIPGGLGYVSQEDVVVYGSRSDIPYPTGADLVDTAKSFLGRPYLWGGTSGYAVDCSGFTHTIYDLHGITIARDADAQADFTPGTSVSQAHLEAGDLMFYATNLTDPWTIYHVAMFVGNGTMAEAYGAGVPIRFTPVRFNSDYWGAQRYLIDTP